MPSLVITNLFDKRITSSKEKNVLKILLSNYIDWMHQCGGKGRCTTCKMKILTGKKYCSAPSPFENKCLQLGLLSANERLACQTEINGEVKISVPEETKLSHQDYSD